MERVVYIGNNKILLKSHAAIPIQYRLHFKEDFFKDVFKLAKSMGEKNTFKELTDQEISGLDFELFFRLFWLFAKAGDSSIPPLAEWLAQFSHLPIEQIMPVIADMLGNLLGQKSKKKSKQLKSNQKKTS